MKQSITSTSIHFDEYYFFLSQYARSHHATHGTFRFRIGSLRSLKVRQKKKKNNKKTPPPQKKKKKKKKKKVSIFFVQNCIMIFFRQ